MKLSELIKGASEQIILDLDALQKNRAYIQDMYKKSCLFSVDFQERMAERYHDILNINTSHIGRDS